ncbi:probable G-protein coupled receptor 174 [Hemitrygon akajei]|uniref:probable G-protein coupled receptor 174 n=1 Tax=Hypanus sabinus TaxID=79690 RepID=UPI0028C40BCC|nr:probable G-protein coupled receptor 174 [Hypanus sabinus]XP_059833462.1 probable G-protein coupled receptor 174 [Hypanus sabinus]XP_059833463.1 probable G-protein coupled receptor 174 [Hypanus sabinus]XP_059833464.1 probable G-protein coupled receptor 174 [Hypanus sabinus]XP_059833466.1 probable G-protein coupled receptor 174 [Hypanus sabinus]
MTNNSSNCTDERSATDLLYAIMYVIIFIPGLIANVLALWVFHAYIKETKRAVIFMINLAIADLAQVMSLPLRIFYYLNHDWPFGRFLCMFCFYLKYVNMYASIFFLVCISIRRCLFLIQPFKYNDCKRMYDVYASIIGWVIVGLACLPFPLMRIDTKTNSSHFNSCFTALPIIQIGIPTSVAMVTLAELTGFVLPLIITIICSWKTIMSLRQKNSVLQDSGEKKKALKMVLTCTMVFLVCFAPYHITFPLHFLALSGRIENCTIRTFILKFHPVALCLASLNCCLDPVIYYFTTDEFRRRLSRQEINENSMQLQLMETCSNNCSFPLCPKINPYRHQIYNDRKTAAGKAMKKNLNP